MSTTNFRKRTIPYEQLTFVRSTMYDERTMMTFSEKLKKLREDKGLTVFQLATKAGIREANYRMMEAGKKPPSEAVMHQLASVPELNITYGQLKAWKILPDLSQADAEFLVRELEKMKGSLPK